jgi:hypothetical protein
MVSLAVGPTKHGAGRAQSQRLIVVSGRQLIGKRHLLHLDSQRSMVGYVRLTGRRYGK